MNDRYTGGHESEFPADERDALHLKKAIAALEADKLDQMLAAHHIYRNAPRSIRLRPTARIWAIAAGFALLLAAALYLSRPARDPMEFAITQTELAARDYDPALRSAAGADILQTALRAVSDGEWASADRLLSTALESTPAHQTGTLEYIWFYRGLTCLQLGTFDRAVDWFGRVIRSPDGNYVKDAMWLRSLALIQSGKAQEARADLEAIAADKSWNKSGDARRLLKSLP